MIQFKISGDKEFKKLLQKLPFNFRTNIVRDIARVGGRVILKEARKQVKIPGTLGKQFSSELIVGNDRSNKTGVVVTVRSGRKSRQFTSSRGQVDIASNVGRHMTEGHTQKKRFTRKKLFRGSVSERYPDPIAAAAASKKDEAYKKMAIKTDEIIKKHVNKYAKKYGR